MEIQQDFKELLELLNAHNVEYVIVGAYALAFHGVPCKDELISNKKTLGRKKDLADIEALEKDYE